MRHALRRGALLALVCVGLAAGCKTTGRAPVYLVKVESGDTLASIAAKYDTTWERIASLNKFDDGAKLKIGRVIRVQPGPGGYVAGAEAAPAAPGRVAKAVPIGEAADASEFTEEDIPSDDKADESKGGSPKKGLLFGGSAGDDRAELSWPLRGELSSLFGKRSGRLHAGIDVRAKRGTEIKSAGVGVVEFEGRRRGYGKTVIIRHATYRTLYGHLNAINVDEGDSVDTSTVIGEVGTSGNASGPHLHFEIRTMAGALLDPLSVLHKDELLSSVH